jgi:hypothetical protein
MSTTAASVDRGPGHVAGSPWARDACGGGEGTMTDRDRIRLTSMVACAG